MKKKTNVLLNQFALFFCKLTKVQGIRPIDYIIFENAKIGERRH